MFLEILQNSQEKKFAGISSLTCRFKFYNFMKKSFRQRCFPVYFTKKFKKVLIRELLRATAYSDFAKLIVPENKIYS